MQRVFLAAVAPLLVLASALAQPERKPPRRAEPAFRVFVDAHPKGEESVVEAILEARDELRQRVDKNDKWFEAVETAEQADIVIELQAYWVREERRTHDETYVGPNGGRHTVQIDDLYRHHSLRSVTTVLGRSREMTGAQVKTGGGNSKGAARDLAKKLERYCKENYWELHERRSRPRSTASSAPDVASETETRAEASRRWIEHEVTDLITDRERELFLSLGSDAERDRLVAAFWDVRDPDRVTPVNERRVEHDERLAEARRRFGGGSQSFDARGRYLVLLGAPRRVETFVGRNEVVSSEIWFYEGHGIDGLPPRFNLLFFQENDTGAYELYSPLGDGPEELLSTFWSGGLANPDRRRTMDVLMAVSTSLARAALTVDLSDPVADFMATPTSLGDADRANPVALRPSVASNVALANILASGSSGVEADYVDGYRLYGGRVDADFSFRYVSSRADWAVLYAADGSPSVHYGLELDPEDVTFRRSEDGSSYEARWQVDIEVRTRAGDVVNVPRREAYLRIDAAEFASAQPYPAAYYDRFPLVPGAYKIAITLRSVPDGRFTVAERNVVVAPWNAGVGGVRAFVLGHATEGPDEEGAFALDGVRMAPAGGARYAAGGTVHALVQAAVDRPESLRVSLQDPDGSVRPLEARPTLHGTTALGLEVRLDSSLPPGEYSLLLDLLDAGGNPVSSRGAAFEIVAAPNVPRSALVYRNVVVEPAVEDVAFTLAEQYLALGELVGAEHRLRRLVEIEATLSPEVAARARWQLASVLLFDRRADEALELLAPLEQGYPDQIEVVEGLGFAFYLRDEFGEALPRFERAMALRPPDTSLLNAAADSFEQLGRLDKARELLELSLEADPSQDGVRARLGALRP